jgi:FlaG/FlaF family flagellin (archaellin)
MKNLIAVVIAAAFATTAFNATAQMQKATPATPAQSATPATPAKAESKKTAKSEGKKKAKAKSKKAESKS